MSEVRAKAWATRRQKYGQSGHAKEAYVRQPVVIGCLRDHLRKALDCLTDEFNAGERSGPSGLRAQAIAHVRYSLLLVDGTSA